MTDVQILRFLSEQEVKEINFVIKSRAYRYIAAAKEAWLYPEKDISKSDWSRFGHGYLFMPDPRPIHWGGEIFWGNHNGGGGAMDEYGRSPWDPDYSKETRSGSEHESLSRFKGEFARLFGPYRRGRSFPVMEIEKERDSDEYHQHLLDLEKRIKKRKRK